MSEHDTARNREMALAFLREIGALPALQNAGLMDDNEFIDQVALRLIDLAQTPANRSDGLRARLGKHHVKFKQAIWASAVAGVQIALIAVDPGQLTGLVLSGQILTYLVTLRALVSKLDEAEVRVYDAISAIQSAKGGDGKMLEVKEAVPADIAARINEQNDEPITANLDQILDNMVSKGAIARVFHDKRGPFYSIVL